jgi:hypothetical protein
MSDEIQVHIDKSPGLTMKGVKFEHVVNPNSRSGKYWIAKANIGTIFGSEVEGELKGIGTTKEKALERLHQEQKELYESLWY